MTVYDLRPLTLGEVFDRAFSIYRAHFFKLIGITTLALVIPYSLYTAALYESQHAVAAGQVNVAAVIVMLVGVIGLLAAYAVVQAAVMHAVSELYLGHPITIGDAYARTSGSIWRILVLFLLQGLGICLGLLLFIVPGILLALRWLVGVPALVVEGLGPGAALSRSMTLTSNMAGRMFVAVLLQFVLGMVVSMVLTMPFTVLEIAAAAKGQISPGIQALSQVGQLLSSVLVFPIASAIVCVLYYDLRVRKEGFDLEQMVSQLGRPAAPSLIPPPPPVAG